MQKRILKGVEESFARTGREAGRSARCPACRHWDSLPAWPVRAGRHHFSVGLLSRRALLPAMSLISAAPSLGVAPHRDAAHACSIFACHACFSVVCVALVIVLAVVRFGPVNAAGWSSIARQCLSLCERQLATPCGLSAFGGMRRSRATSPCAARRRRSFLSAVSR